MIRTVIFGGSFDPVHKGHEEIINNLADRFDEVIVIPTSVSPFKQGGSAASGEIRLKMLRECSFRGNVTVSDYEINKQGCSYSIDTVRHFYSDERQLYFAIGSEGARSVDRWKCSDELKKLCRFYVIKRPGYDDGTLGDEFVQADFCGEDVSSSEVKVAVAFGKIGGLVNKNVEKIILQSGLYTDYVKFTDAYKIFGLKAERIDHTYRTTLEGIKLAKRYDVDVADAIVALLLHDIGKYVTPAIMEEMNIPVPNCDELPSSCRHAEYGAAICEHYFKLKPSIVEAVRTHTTGGLNMDRLGEIVALADYVEPGRDFGGLEIIRQAACISLSLAMELMLKNTLDYLSAQNIEIAPITKKVYRYYLELNRRNKKNGTN